MLLLLQDWCSPQGERRGCWEANQHPFHPWGLLSCLPHDPGHHAPGGKRHQDVGFKQSYTFSNSIWSVTAIKAYCHSEINYFLFAVLMRFLWRFWLTTTLLDAWLGRRDAISKKSSRTQTPRSPSLRKTHLHTRVTCASLVLVCTQENEMKREQVLCWLTSCNEALYHLSFNMITDQVR